MENELISVIVPVYDVEKYIRTCVESIIQQTYCNLEIIIVDDGTKDQSAFICEEYLKKDNRIKIIHKENGGLSDARNVGIENANGSFIMFVDSDDYINTNMIEVLYNAIRKEHAEISVCDFENVEENESKQFEVTVSSDSTITITDENRYEYFVGDKLVPFTVAWCKLYKLSLWKQIRYPIGKIYEDEYITYKLLHGASKVIYVDEKMYYYRQRTNSIMGKEDPMRNLEKLEPYKTRIEYYIKKEMYDFVYRILKLYMYCLRICIKNSNNYKVTEPYLKYYLKTYFKYINRNQEKFKSKIEDVLFILFRF